MGCDFPEERWSQAASEFLGSLNLLLIISEVMPQRYELKRFIVSRIFLLFFTAPPLTGKKGRKKSICFFRKCSQIWQPRPAYALPLVLPHCFHMITDCYVSWLCPANDLIEETEFFDHQNFQALWPFFSHCSHYTLEITFHHFSHARDLWLLF